jgi:hypothetical protein
MMGVNFKKCTIPPACFIIILLILISGQAMADCDPFAVDPYDSNFCDGNGGNPDDLSSPLDNGVTFLIAASAMYGAFLLNKGRKVRVGD